MTCKYSSLVVEILLNVAVIFQGFVEMYNLGVSDGSASRTEKAVIFVKRERGKRKAKNK